MRGAKGEMRGAKGEMRGAKGERREAKGEMRGASHHTHVILDRRCQKQGRGRNVAHCAVYKTAAAVSWPVSR